MNDYIINSEGIRFVPIKENLLRYVILKELLDNDQADPSDDHILVPHEEIVQLSEYDQSLLGLPKRYPFDICIDTQGAIHEETFSFRWGFYEYEQGPQLYFERTGSVLQSGDGSSYLLNREQFRLCGMLDDFTQDQRPTEEKWRAIAAIQTQAVRASAYLSVYLKNEKIYVPEKISLSVNPQTDDSITIHPEIDHPKNNDFVNKFDRFKQVQSIYTLQDEDGTRNRIVPTPAQKKALQTIKEKQKLQGEEKQQFIQHPEMFIDPDPGVVDLDLFSKRVKEYGLFIPKAFPFISPYKSEWIPGFVVDGEKITVPANRVGYFEDLIQQADEDGKTYIEYDGKKVSLPDAREILNNAKKQHASPKDPVASEDQDKADFKKCLIIYDNIENLDYNTEKNTEKEKAYYFHPIPNLKNHVTLLPHQKAGVAWLQALSPKIPGVLLADDMGLGKTLQILSFLNWVNENQNKKRDPFLIVAPISLLENWGEEYHKFFEFSMPVTMVTSQFFRHHTLESIKSVSPFEQSTIYLTNYDTLRSKSVYFAIQNWRVVILDEAQSIKNPSTIICNTAKSMKADFNIAVTGTPVENTFMDLWCIMDFAYPGLLGSAKEFAKKYQSPLHNKETDIAQLGESIRKEIGICMRRNLKKEILSDLPPIHYQTLKEPMPPIQLDRYVKTLDKAKNLTEGQGRVILQILHELRDISDHPYIPDRQVDLYYVEDLIASSAKLNAIISILDEIQAANEKVLLFAERKETQKLLAKILREKYHISSSIINGDTPARANRAKTPTRQAIIHEFNQKPGFNALVLSPIVAGAGFNITGANHVIHYSRHWNPAKEQQATDRVYRIGQDKEVHVYYPMAVCEEFDTFDVLLNGLLSRKKDLSESSLYPSDQLEVKPADLFGNLRDSTKEPIDSTPQYYTLTDLDTLNPYLFEAAVAVLWGKISNQPMLLTPQTNDKGADVAVLDYDNPYLFQVKQSKNPIDHQCIKDIILAKKYYQNRFGMDFELGIVTNRDLNSNAYERAEEQGVNVFNRLSLETLLQKHPITDLEVLAMEARRSRD